MFVALFAASLAAFGASDDKIIYPDTHWNDTDGNRIEAHAAGMLQSPLDKRWYWYGESKKTSSLADHGVNLYSSDTIAGPWKNEGQVFHQQDIQMQGEKGPFIVERPKVLYNEQTKKFVMWFHLDTGGYKFRHAGVAVSDTPNGHFKFVHGMQPDGIPSLDMSLFRDPQDGQAYFVRSCDNKYTGISRLSPDYLSSAGMISNHSVFEGMALFRHPNGTYYMMTSHLTGWNPNPLMLFRAEGKTLDDPQWFNMGNPTGSPTSFNTQPTYVVSYTPASGNPYFVYMGDDWIRCPPDGGLINACYSWLPINFHESEGTITMEQRAHWSLDDPFAPGTASKLREASSRISFISYLSFSFLFPSAYPPHPPPHARSRRLQVRVSSAAAPGQHWELPTGASPGPIKIAASSSSASAPTLDPKLLQGVAGAGDRGRIMWPAAAANSDSNSNPADSVCLASNGRKLTTAACDGSKSQEFTYSASTKHIKTPTNQCLDVTWCGSAACAGDSVGIYDCNDVHQNQEFQYDTSTKQLKAPGVHGLCLDLCA